MISSGWCRPSHQSPSRKRSSSSLPRRSTPAAGLDAASVDERLSANRLLDATFVEDGPEIRLHGAIHLGIGSATRRVLVVPVVTDADGLQGSIFTVSKLGALGLDHVVEGEVVALQTSTLTLAFDHRVCDGVEVAGLLGDLRELVETPELALLGSVTSSRVGLSPHGTERLPTST